MELGEGLFLSSFFFSLFFFSLPLSEDEIFCASKISTLNNFETEIERKREWERKIVREKKSDRNSAKMMNYPGSLVVLNGEKCESRSNQYWIVELNKVFFFSLSVWGRRKKRKREEKEERNERKYETESTHREPASVCVISFSPSLCFYFCLSFCFFISVSKTSGCHPWYIEWTSGLISIENSWKKDIESVGWKSGLKNRFQSLSGKETSGFVSVLVIISSLIPLIQ